MPIFFQKAEEVIVPCHDVTFTIHIMAFLSFVIDGSAS